MKLLETLLSGREPVKGLIVTVRDLAASVADLAANVETLAMHLAMVAHNQAVHHSMIEQLAENQRLALSGGLDVVDPTFPSIDVDDEKKPN